MTLAQKSHRFVTPVGRVRYGDDVFDPPAGSPPGPLPAAQERPAFIERFHALVEELTDTLLAGQAFDRERCRADAIEMLFAASQHFGTMDEPESPLQHLLREERQAARAALRDVAAPLELTLFKA